MIRNRGVSGVVVLIPFAVIALGLMLFDPIPQPAQSFVVFALAAIVASGGVRAWFADRDDVLKESRRVASLWGAPLGFAAALVAVVFVRYATPVSDALAAMAAANVNAPPSTVGFGMGVVVALICVLLANAAVYVGWWARKR
jgi:hypothetical protein